MAILDHVIANGRRMAVTRSSAVTRKRFVMFSFLDMLIISTEVLFIQEVSGAYTFLFLDTDELKMVSGPRKVPLFRNPES